MQDFKRESFLYNMVAADFFPYRNLERDSRAMSLANKLREEIGRDDGAFYMFYANRITYTVSMTFDWHDESPPEFLALETFWNMVQKGEPDTDCYMYYISNVSNPVSNQWQDALEEAHTIWKPPVEKLSKDDEKEITDPN